MNSDAPPKSNNKKKRLLIFISLMILIIAIIIWVIWWLFFSNYQSTDNAYVGGNAIEISARQHGNVIAFYADDTDLVQEGQLLVRLDPTDYLIEFEKQKAAFALATRNVQKLWDQVEIENANVALNKARLELAQQEYADRSGLITSGAISQEEFEQYKTSNEAAKANYAISQAEQQTALNARGTTSKENHPQILEAKMRLIDAYIALQRCFIYAPQTGFVAKRTVQVGQNIKSDLPLMSVVPLNEIWVDANFKETQLKNIRIGQPANVTVDLYGDKLNFPGKVLGFYPGTGSVFSLLPPQNATGNWIKIVQRLPVRIALSCEEIRKYPLFLGLSTEVEIDISDTSGLMLSQTPSTQKISSTTTYEVPIEPLYPLIEQILKQNFSNE